MGSNVWLTSDLHLGHSKILKYQPNRQALGSNVEEMNEALIQNWNAVVKPNDEVYNLGDFLFYHDPTEAENILRRLNGKQFLVLGNNDHIIKQYPSVFEKHFGWIRDYHEAHLGDKHIVMSHFPLALWHEMHNGAFHTHGHCHGHYVDPRNNRCVDVSVDSTLVTGNHEHRPFALEEIEAAMRTRGYTSALTRKS